MTDDVEKSSPSPGSKSRKIILSISCGLILLLVVLIPLTHEFEKMLASFVATRLARVEGLSFKIGQISLGFSGVHIEEIAVRRAGQEEGPGILFTGVQARPKLLALLRGTVPIDQLNISRVGVLPDGDPALENIVVSMQPMNDSNIMLNFMGKTNPGQVSGTVQWNHQPPFVHVRGDLKSEDFRFFHPKIARAPIHNIDADLTFAARYDAAQDQLHIDETRLSSHGLEGIVSGAVLQVRTKPQVALSLTIPSVPCQTLLDALPREFIPDLQGFQLTGNFAAQLKLAIDFDKLEETRLTGYRGFRDCEMVEAPAHLDHKYFQGSFQHKTRLVAGESQSFQVGPENPDYVPYTQFSDAIIGAFLATEDISFFQHAGYLSESLALAIGLNLQENRFAMGGSTITMQMVKNVFLSHEKTLSRKVQELFLTDYVERTLGKQRIMEIYLNVIEFGPGIFGIGPAALHYFGKPVQALNQLESVYLASIIYSPRRHYGSYCRGNISKSWDQRLRQLLQLMRDKELISGEDFLASQDQSIVFRKPALGCQKNGEIRSDP